MFRKFLLSLLLLVGMFLCASIRADARQAGYTCTGGHLYFEVQGSDGSWTCMELAGGCPVGQEWSIYYNIRAIRPRGNQTVYQPANTDEAQALTRLRNLKESDITQFYRATNAVLNSYHRRANFPKARKAAVLFEDELPKWLVNVYVTGIPPEVVAKGSCPGDLYPNPKPGGGHNCYPCLGCTPCGDSYCSLYRVFTNDDLSPALVSEGYFVRGGRIHKRGRAKSDSGQ
jgi:hypothetical protein